MLDEQFQRHYTDECRCTCPGTVVQQQPDAQIVLNRRSATLRGVRRSVGAYSWATGAADAA